MFPIVHARQLSDAVFEMGVHAPAIAKKAKAGQFLMLRIDEDGERIPLTFSDWSAEEGWIRFIFMRVGKTTHKLSNLGVGDSLADVVGPLGVPTHVEDMGRVVVVGGGVGTAVAYPVARAMCAAGAEVTVIVGARNADLVILEDEFRALPLKELIVTTDDGSAGRKDLVTAPLKELCEAGAVDHAMAIGPVIMMKFCAATTREYKVPTVVSLNPIMVDGTGMCGACRCTVDGETKFGCVDGPDFDGHAVDFEELMSRQRVYSDDERLADAEYDRECRCHS
ncbi:MAG: sulfide/dihydroorotate dehydrogenase-like FAD/NAD-binding protein [Coriobacteriia bacterium]|nr:sulfide/dihydroorotate dehydrogenase-like FAD/NAD-binding protein [Coriobacteriia bacterium]MBN2841160.1 sulfide/dihydroorotate dehydrogenase-like FAD/NAD-binding protein [Coriobacteriia bacterium]